MEINSYKSGLFWPFFRSVWMKLCLAAVIMLAPLHGLTAAELEKPSGEVLLKITGNISNTNADGEAWFDLKMLQSFGVTEIRTETPWTQGIAKFEGVLIQKLLEAVGAGSTDFEAIALNMYQYDFSELEYEDYPVILAWKLNDDQLTVRTLGPLWIMFPYTDHPELKNEFFHNAAVWQLIEISVN